MARVNRTGQRGEISELCHSCMQLSRCWEGKSNNRKLTKVNIRETNRNLEDKIFLVSTQEYSHQFWISKIYVHLVP